ncbi:MAG: GNAT family N-acetyltransferase [Clostridiales bacterium]|nr:GNAT family N-acetyltransferase [Clostridiales bacterium]
MEFRFLTEKDIDPSLFRHFERRQAVTDRWQKIDGKWVVVNDPFVDDWGADDYSEMVAVLKSVITENGLAVGAFADEKLKGFAAVRATPFGQHKEYLDLQYIHVSEDLRGRGIGRVLFGKAGEWAKAHGAKRLYISAQSSVETQAFYRAMGCVEAKEYEPEHVRREPYDCQLELEL